MKVITWDNMKNFARETRRVAAWHYVQTPYFWFPVDPHFYTLPFYHWLPRPLRAKLLMRLPLAHAGTISKLEKAHQIVDGVRLIHGAHITLLFPKRSLHFYSFI